MAPPHRFGAWLQRSRSRNPSRIRSTPQRNPHSADTDQFLANMCPQKHLQVSKSNTCQWENITKNEVFIDNEVWWLSYQIHTKVGKENQIFMVNVNAFMLLCGINTLRYWPLYWKALEFIILRVLYEDLNENALDRLDSKLSISMEKFFAGNSNLD